MFKSGAVPSQDGAGRGSDGEGLAAAPHEEPQTQHQLGSAPSSQASQSLSPPPHRLLQRDKDRHGRAGALEGSAKIIHGNIDVRGQRGDFLDCDNSLCVLMCSASHHVT